MTMIDFCEQYDYTVGQIDHIRKKLKIGHKELFQGKSREQREQYVFNDDDVSKLLEFLDARKDATEPKGFTKTKGRKFLCPRCGTPIKKGTERCPNRNCKCHDHGFDWEWTLSHLPKKITWTTQLSGKVAELNKIK